MSQDDQLTADTVAGWWWLLGYAAPCVFGGPFRLWLTAPSSLEWIILINICIGVVFCGSHFRLKRFSAGSYRHKSCFSISVFVCAFLSINSWWKQQWRKEKLAQLSRKVFTLAWGGLCQEIMMETPSQNKFWWNEHLTHMTDRLFLLREEGGVVSSCTNSWKDDDIIILLIKNFTVCEYEHFVSNKRFPAGIKCL